MLSLCSVFLGDYPIILKQICEWTYKILISDIGTLSGEFAFHYRMPSRCILQTTSARIISNEKKKLHSISKVHALTHSTRSILWSRSPVECSLNSSLQTLKRDKGGRKEWVRKWNVSRGLRILGQSTAHLSPSGYYGARGKRYKEKLLGGIHYHQQQEGRKHYLQHSNADLPEVQSILVVTTALPKLDQKRNTRVWLTNWQGHEAAPLQKAACMTQGHNSPKVLIAVFTSSWNRISQSSRWIYFFLSLTECFGLVLD